MVSAGVGTSRGAARTPTLQADDIVAGLGVASRDLLATCLARFDDSSLQQQLSERIDALTKKPSRDDTAEHDDNIAALTSLQKRVMDWMNAPAAGSPAEGLKQGWTSGKSGRG